MPQEKIRIATRQSALALWQANHVADLLRASFPAVTVELVGMTTTGDRNRRAPLGEIGGKGVFVKELEAALLNGEADIAVHSMKDVPGELPSGLAITGICKRADPRDALLCQQGASGGLADLPQGSQIGTGSARRRLQLQQHFPQLEFREIRGNVDTRISKLDAGDFAAIILAVAGLQRLGQEARITHKLDTDLCVPAAGQGAVGMESRLDDEAITSIMGAITDAETMTCVTAERQVTACLGADCTLPIGVYAEVSGDEISIRAFVADLQGKQVVREAATGNLLEAEAVARGLGERLIDLGAAAFTETGR